MSNQKFANSIKKYSAITSGLAVYKLAANQSIPNNADTKINTWTQEYSTLDDNVSYASGDFTINSSGVYCIQLNTLFDINAVGGRNQSILYTGGPYSGRVANCSDVIASGVVQSRLFSSVIIEATVGDIFSLQCLQDSGGALNLLGNASDPFTKVLITRIY